MQISQIRLISVLFFLVLIGNKMRSYSLFKKDFRSELRTRYAINSLAMFIIVAISVILFSIGNETITESLTGGLYWVVIFFTAMSGLAQSFCF